ncbi:MAG TPA: DMT family transporter [Tepidisphaeraceae bacterium]|nr:DMT family transporter [Tepidisphaeraceae bacterium]
MYGPYFALGTAVCWMISAIAFENASRRVGSVPVNLIRLLVAFALLSALGWWRFGNVLPAGASAEQWKLLLLSGLLGFFVGDLALFRAFVVLGARLTTLLMCLAPPIAAVTEWLWLGNPITLLQGMGMLVTLAGVSWVVFEKPAPEDAAPGPAPEYESEARLGGPGTTVLEYRAGQAVRHITPWAIFLGVVAAAGQGVGLVCTKVAMSTPPALDAFTATQIRIIAGVATFIGLVVFTGRVGDCGAALRDRTAVLLLTIGAIAGPFLGVSLLNKAVELIPSGVAQTITSLVPVLIIPISVFVLKEQVRWRAVAGALVAVAGVAMLVL